MIRISAMKPSPYSGQPSLYVVARQEIWADTPIACLAPFSAKFPEAATQAASFVLEAGPVTLIHRVNAWVGGAWREVTSSRVEEQGYQIRVDGIGLFNIQPDGGAIVFTEPDSGVSEALIEEALLGPALTLALAAREVFCLHASAWLVDGQTVALVGESGSGKSTLAAALAQRHGGWRRIADDALPVTLSDDGPLALPHFPQLKLPRDRQIDAHTPSAAPLFAVYLLDAVTGATQSELYPLNPQIAATTLIEHTMTTSLFDAPLLASHIDFCASAAASVLVRRLAYPHYPLALPQAIDLLTSDVTELLERKP